MVEMFFHEVVLITHGLAAVLLMGGRWCSEGNAVVLKWIFLFVGLHSGQIVVVRRK